ncbi:SusC/RagA family TonB-linked outer membrane protein [Portibacter marinus]|uniref:SusC/RagA family TonB-linked outer membrane protein n=1 Tax=Portibacter marinus TaxID=2898660 RepID=UPI001F27B327|nr:TonB-dependent receptor [Portibacter marinus]
MKKLLGIAILIAFGWTGSLLAQSMVKGTVLSSDGTALPGVNITQKGTTNGTATDFDGNYSLELIGGQNILVFSYIGFETLEEPVNSRENVSVTLAESSSTLDEVVVVGYGTQKKVNLTGAVDVVRAEQLADRPIVSTGEGLQGLVPNLNVTITSGDPTDDIDFNVRGFESINGGAPLVLVDNVPMDLNRINPEDIKSISVLKDGAASAIYGARAAFGVILVETKTGSSGVNVSLGTQLSWNKAIFHVDPIENGYVYALERNAIWEREGDAPVYNDDYLAGLERYWSDPENNPAWALVDGAFQHYGYNNLANDLVSGVSPRQKYDISVSGATDRSNFYTSFGHLNTDGFYNHPGNDNFKRYNVLMKGDFQAKNWLSFNTQLTMNMQYSDKPSAPSINTIIRTEPLRPHVIPRIDGYEQYEGMFWDHGLMILPQLTNGGRQKFSNSDVWMKAGVKADLLQNLSFVTDFSYNIFNRQFESARPLFQTVSFNLDQDNPVNIIGDDMIEVDRRYDQYYVFNARLEYEINNKSNHYLKAMVGFNQEYDYNTRVFGEALTLVSPELIDIGATTGAQQISGSKSHASLRGAFYRLNYIYDDRYLFEFNGRYDGTSRFPKEDRFGFFPSFSAGWRISEESFMDGTDAWLDNLKVRASYGSLGNQLLGNNFYPYIPSLNSGTSNFVLSDGFTPFISDPGLVSPTLTWERVTTRNLGLDLSLINGKLSSSFDIYTRATTGMLTRRDYPDILGTQAPQENSADLETSGWEFSLTWRDGIGKGVSYYTTFNLADWTSIITKYDNPTGSLDEYYVGQQIGEIWGFETVGIIQDEEQLAQIADQGRVGNGWDVGDIQYADLDGDGIISTGENTLENPGDRKIIGNNTPRLTFGVNSGISWNGISVNAFFQGVGRRDYYPSSGNWTWFFPWRSYNGDKSWLTETWAEDRRDAYFPQSERSNKNFVTQTRFLQPASYIRLKNLNIAYQLPISILKGSGIGGAKVYVGGQNLWEYSNIRRPLDPEYVFNNSINYPLFRSFTVGANVNF